jgi:hypothetical protein
VAGLTGYDPGDNAVIRETFEDPPESIVTMGGPASQKFFGRSLRRGAFVGIQGPEKRGKTWWCMEFLYRAVRDRRRVALFTVGDESRNEVNLRWYSRLAETPFDEYRVRYPVELTLEGTDHDLTPVVKYDDKTFDVGITPRQAMKARRRFHERHRLSDDECYYRFWNYPMGTISVSGIHEELCRERDERGLVPDVIVIDYLDVLAPEKDRRDNRDMVNETWMRTKRLAQEWHACVIAPTQADADSYSAKTQSMKNFSNDKRKNAHVTSMLGLNQTDEEKDMGVMRLNWLVRRGEGSNPRRCLWVAQCLPLGMAMVRSAL